MSDHYQTIAAPALVRQKIDRSGFLGIALPVTTEEAFFEELSRVSREHFDASHHCWAFRLRERVRSADAGEPSGTAGKPILSAIESAGIFEVAVIVVRWFGGIKLGTGGLSRAYRDTAAQALSGADRIDRYLYVRFQVTVPFSSLSAIYRLIHPPHVVLIEENFGDTNTFTIDVRESHAEALLQELEERRLAYTSVPPE